MTKEYEIADKPAVVLKSVKCDKCGKSCLGAFFDIECKMSFSEKTYLIETVCFECYEKKYKKRIFKRRNTQ